jgi:gluconokinase
VGSGCATDRRIAINLGTSGAIRVLFPAERVEIPDDLWCYRLDRQRFVMGGAFSDGGEVAVWMRETLRLPDWEQALRAAEALAPDSHGLTFLPFLAGERSTGWRPHARATLHGLSTSTTPEQILRAGMEAVALRFALVYDRLREQFPNANEIIAAGGGFKQAPFWAQIVADALGAPLLLSEESEATSRGAAAVALRAAGVFKDEAKLPAPSARRIEPEAAHHSVYRNALARQQALYEALLRL